MQLLAIGMASKRQSGRRTISPDRLSTSKHSVATGGTSLSSGIRADSSVAGSGCDDDTLTLTTMYASDIRGNDASSQLSSRSQRLIRHSHESLGSITFASSHISDLSTTRGTKYLMGSKSIPALRSYCDTLKISDNITGKEKN